MKKKNSLLKLKTPSTRLQENMSLPIKTQHLQLPRIEHTQYFDQIAKKTLLTAISKIEEYTSSCYRKIPSHLE